MSKYRPLRWTVLVVLFAGPQLAGCSQYMDRSDTIAFSAGEAVQTNIVTHVTDPWPVYARNKDIAFSGERIARAVRRYECGPAAPSTSNGGGASGGGLASPTININNGPAAGASEGSAGDC